MVIAHKNECMDLKECNRKRDKWNELQEKFCSVGQNQLDKFLLGVKGKIGEVRFDKHFTKRSLERSISDNDVREVLNYGWVVERNKTIKNTSVVVLGYVGKSYRPIHVVFDIVGENLWVAVTAYNPKSHYWKWSDTFDSRVCFCNFEEE